jgi:hypothetical protein
VNAFPNAADFAAISSPLHHDFTERGQDGGMKLPQLPELK